MFGGGFVPSGFLPFRDNAKSLNLIQYPNLKPGLRKCWFCGGEYTSGVNELHFSEKATILFAKGLDPQRSN